MLLIGGASGVGKSSVAYPLARQTGVNLTEIDDFKIVVETLYSPAQQPALHYWRTNWDEFFAWPDETMLAHSIEVGGIFRPALSAVIEDHLSENSPVLLEGAFLVPELAA